MKASFRSTIEVPWTGMEPVRLGQVPAGHGTPDEFVLVESAGRPILRVDLYASRDETNTFADVCVWGDLLLVGWGDRVYVVNPQTRLLAQTVEMEGYFGHFYVTLDYALAASAERLYRFTLAGTLMWCSESVGIDGVVVDSVEGGVVAGRGEWDPPDGWRPFRLDLDSGHLR